MRLELIHFLSTVNEEHVMRTVLNNLNAEGMATLFHHLEYASSDTKERWLSQFNQMMR
ncbi:hypothetical protein FHS18_004907 [Paenibacillus phyllosphaerae]|uniref:Uncharacterized protein n=1 Tax=Paenibacillus phyllosphaerae TaxID=274593 RepID=A0A7W5B1N9_9BACL|nr:hypothetical protein [Paenibacillus phyllosphaerae]MBB3112805.1 hypothetical protein [Paenibacillus phyllosphaerae]